MTRHDHAENNSLIGSMKAFHLATKVQLASKRSVRDMKLNTQITRAICLLLHPARTFHCNMKEQSKRSSYVET
jgi:hypothetical protein